MDPLLAAQAPRLVAPPGDDDDDATVWKPARTGAVAALAVLAACANSRSGSTVSQPSTSLPIQYPTTATEARSQPVPQQLGRPFTLGELRLTVLDFQDPFPPTPQVQPASGNRLVSIKYEVVNQSSASQNVSDLPSVGLQDSTGASYRSEHGRLSMVAGSRTPGQLLAGKRTESSVLFEVPSSAVGLVLVLRPMVGAEKQEQQQGAVVGLD